MAELGFLQTGALKQGTTRVSLGFVALLLSKLLQKGNSIIFYASISWSLALNSQQQPSCLGLIGIRNELPRS